MNSIIKSKHLLPLIILVFLTILAHHVWFFNLSLLTHGDFFVDFIERIKEVFALPYIWQGSYNLGSINLGLSFWPFIAFAGFLAKINISSALSERIVFLWPTALFMPIFMYCLAYYIFRSRIGAFIAAIAYTFNAASLVGRTGHLTVQVAIAFAPLFILFFILTLNQKRVILAILTAFVGFVISFYEFRYFYLTVWIVFFYFLYHLIVIEHKKNLQLFFQLCILSLISVIIPFLLNAYMFLGTISLNSLTTNAIFNRGLTGQAYVDLLKGVSFFPYLWTGGKFYAFVVQPIMFRFFLIPIMAFLSLIFLKRNKYIIFFAILGLIGILLLKQGAVPFPHLYEWIFDHIPGFAAFRETTKFYFYIAISYSILVGGFIAGLNSWAKTRASKTLALILTTFTVILFLLNTKPFITTEVGTLFVPRFIPKDYLVLKDFILGQKEYFRIYWLPTTSRWGVYTDNHPRMSGVEMYNTAWKEITSHPLTNYDDLLHLDSSDNLFDQTSIKYVIIPVEDKKNDDDFYLDYGSKKLFVKRTKTLSFLKQINIGTIELLIFENNNYRPHIYISKNKETIKKIVPYQNINYETRSSTEYKIFLKRVGQPFYLNFSENYHPDWKLKVGTFSWLDAFFQKKYFLSDKDHFQNDAKLNSFFIDPAKICYRYICRKNSDGSFDFDITLYFKPQATVYVGLFISAITLISCLSFLIYYFIKLLANLKKLHSSKP